MSVLRIQSVCHATARKLLFRNPANSRQCQGASVAAVTKRPFSMATVGQSSLKNTLRSSIANTTSVTTFGASDGRIGYNTCSLGCGGGGIKCGEDLQRRFTHTVGGLQPTNTPGVTRNHPLSATEAPWPMGIASFMRLPLQRDTKGLDACIVGVPLDIGVSNRNGCRFGPRQIRYESIGVRPYNPATEEAPFQDLQIADIGDVGFTMYNLPEALKQIRVEFNNIVSDGCIPLTMGGDHTITYPILQAIAKKHGPVAVVHVDAHADTTDSVWGSKGMHATPFRRAVEENLVLPQYCYQIGLRGSTYEKGSYNWSKEQGFTVVPATECWHKSLTPLMEQVRQHIQDQPVYLTFDIDAIDPCFCPGTGTREVGGLTTIQALELVRGLKGLNIVGCDLVEVSPPFDSSSHATSHMAANLLFEMLCALPAVKSC